MCRLDPRCALFGALVLLVCAGACHSDRSAVQESSSAKTVVSRIRERAQVTSAALRFSRDGDGLIPQLGSKPIGTQRRARVRYGLKANSPVRLEDAATGSWVSTTLLETAPVPAEAVEGFVTWRGAFRAGDLVHRPLIDGTEDYVWLEQPSATSELSYDVVLGDHIAGLRLVGNVLEFLDASGDPRLRVNPPYVIDSGEVRHEAAISIGGCSVDRSPLPPWGRPVTPPGATHCTVRIAWAQLAPTAYPALIDPAWVTTGAMSTPREEHRAVWLSSPGLVLVTGGGVNGANPTSSCELYNPGTGTWSPTGSMNDARMQHTLTQLLDGRLLATGGQGTGDILNTAELYDPGTGAWHRTGGNMNRHRCYHSAALQPGTGHVLITGGNQPTGITHSTEAYFPETDTWVALNDMNDNRERHGSAFVNGRPIVFGGNASSSTFYKSTEYLDLIRLTWNKEAALNGARANFAMVQRSDGSVVVAGGLAGSSQVNTVEILDPVSFTWSQTGSMNTTRSAASLNQFVSGTLLVAGGKSGSTWLDSVETYDPGTGAWTTIAGLNLGRGLHTGTVIGDGMVLVAGGSVGGGTTNTAEVIRIPQTCGSGSDCLSGACVSGYCCNSACDQGPCERCDLAGQEGLCTLVPAGQQGAQSCAPSTCGGVSPACQATCASDSACTAGNLCIDGQCSPPLLNGSPCDTARLCGSGYCVDGVCCDSACDGACAACSTALGAAADGQCSPVPTGTAGNPSCGAYLCDGLSSSCPTTCSDDAQCSGRGVCTQGQCVGFSGYAQGSACGFDSACLSGHCVDGVCCDSACQGACSRCNDPHQPGTCTPLAAHTSPDDGECLPYLCDGVSGSCPLSCQSPTDCTDGFTCIGGACVTAQAQGVTCSSPSDCQSGFCVDGVCCDSSCEGSCASCALPGQVGTCGLVTGAPAAGRPLCDGDGPCGAACDGRHAECIYPPATAVCSPAFCSDDMATAASFCDGAGRCVRGAQAACPEGCAGDQCAEPSDALVRPSCASVDPTALGMLLALLVPFRKKRRLAGR